MNTFDLEKVCTMLKEQHGITAYVEQTGGGVATIYAGEPYDGDEGYQRYPAIAGPGWFDGPGWTKPMADTSDFSVGPDTDDNFDTSVMADDGWDEAKVVEVIAEQVGKVRA